MDIYTEYTTPAELTGYARVAVEDRPENQLILSRWFPYNASNSLTYKFNKGGDKLLEAAEFRAWDTEPGFGRRAGIAKVSGELPPIGQQYVLDEFSNLRQRNAEDEEFKDLFLNDAERIGRQVDIRMEFARAEALVSGTVTIKERNMELSVDFGRKSTHSVAPAVLWSDQTNSVPLDNLQTWRDLLSDDGEAPGAVLMSPQAINHVLRSAQIRGQVFPLASSAPQVSRAQLDQVLMDFDLPPIIKYDAKARRNGVMQRFIPADKVIMLPASGGGLGATVYGLTLEAQLPEYGIGRGSELPGLVVAPFIRKETPVQVLTIGSAIALPILGAPDDTLVADVF